MHIAKDEHVLEPILAPTLVTAVSLECLRILECSKEHVPKRDVREIVCVMLKLMMDAVRFGPLENETEPRGSFDIPVIKKFSERNEDCVIPRCVNTAAEQWINNQTAEYGIDPDFHWVFIKAGDDLQSTSRVVDLMKCPPEKLRLMAIPMPPVINKGGEEIDDQRRRPIAEMVFQMKDRHVIEPEVPGSSGQHGNAELDRVDQDHPAPPCINPGQFHCGPQALGQDATGCDSKNDEHAHASMIG